MIPQTNFSHQAAAGSDIKRKGGRSKKGKRLIVLPGNLGLKSGEDCELGLLEGVHGPNPTITATFPDGGRLRFSGRVVAPEQRFLHLQVHFEVLVRPFLGSSEVAFQIFLKFSLCDLLAVRVKRFRCVQGFVRLDDRF